MAFDKIKEAFELVAQDGTKKHEHCAGNHAQKHGPYAANHCVRWRTRRSHNVVPVPATATSFPLEDYGLVGLWEKTHKLVVCNLWRKVRLEATRTGFLVVQTGESFEQAKVFKAHAVPRGLCAILINPLKLLANQQEDGDGLLQNIVTNVGKGRRKGLSPDGLRELIEVDNERALDVGALRPGHGNI